MNNDASLKEYYIRLQRMYCNAVSLLTGIEQSLKTSSPEIQVPISDTDDSTSFVRIPSFLYLESKIEEIGNNIDMLFNMPEDGEAWLKKDKETYKLDLVRCNTAPSAPTIDYEEYASFKQNDVLKDFVSPKTYIKFNLDNIPSNVSEMMMKKFIFYNKDAFDIVVSEGNVITYEDLKAKAFNLRKGIDYDEYDKILKMPIKKDMYKSSFKIVNIENGQGYPYSDTQKIRYDLTFDTLEYSDADDSAISYILKPNDILCLKDRAVTYKVISVDYRTSEVTLESSVGNAILTTYQDNSQMEMSIYNDDYSKYEYVEIPLEENEYVVVFLSTIWNNVKSLYSEGIAIDLTTVYMNDEFGNPILDGNGNKISYIDYYNRYCSNIGDLIDAISKTAYSQISNYTVDELEELLDSDTAKTSVSDSIKGEGILSVIPINSHLTDTLTNEDIVNLHNQKNELNSKLQTCQSNIDQVYSTMLTTDFSQNVAITQQSLQEKLQSYYTERTSLQKQLNAVIDNINSKSADANITKTKYRIRGISDTAVLDSFISKFNNVSLISMDIMYRYKTTNKDTNSIVALPNSTFTDWNIQHTEEKERKLVFENNGYSIKFESYSNNANEIKWNQIDIPIRYGEDVVLKVRYKYSVGQPFISLYTPWSDEITVAFPQEYMENTEIDSILKTNENDTISATFSKTLINDGYAEHIQNKILSNEQVFFHMPENIYSGFNTPENNLISLKDKLNEMNNTIEEYKSYIEGLSNSSYDVYLIYDDNEILLTPNTLNKINIYNTGYYTDSFIRKDMNIVIKNTGTSNLKMYSVFPGNVDEHLITSVPSSYPNKGDYERVPIMIGDKIDGQYLGQWIYFRQNNPFNNQDLYFNDLAQNAYDWSIISDTDNEKKIEYMRSFTDYITEKNSQVLLGFRNNFYKSNNDVEYILANIPDSEESEYANIVATINSMDVVTYEKSKLPLFETYVYSNMNDLTNEDENANKNAYIVRYEDLLYKDDNEKLKYLTMNDSISEIKKSIISFSDDNHNIEGAFLFPNLSSKTQLMTNGGEFGFKAINSGSSLSLPVVFEYYVSEKVPNVSKTICFDLRNSLIEELKHYIVEITGNYDYSNYN